MEASSVGIQDHLDVCDRHGIWCTAKVLEVDHEAKLVRVHYDGLDESEDETITITSPRIAAFGSRTKWFRCWVCLEPSTPAWWPVSVSVGAAAFPPPPLTTRLAAHLLCIPLAGSC